MPVQIDRFVLLIRLKLKKQSRKHESTKARNKKMFFFVFLTFRDFVIKILFVQDVHRILDAKFESLIYDNPVTILNAHFK